MPLKTRMRSFIASRNGGFIASILARTAEKYLNAYNNFANWDIETNGELRAIRRILTVAPGDLIDAGANEGQWASAVAPYLGDRTLHSFEPVPQIFLKLRHNLEGIGKIKLINCGLGREEKDVLINFVGDASTISSAYPLIYYQERSSAVPCKLTTGDRYLSENNIEAISILKIDVEGMEADCLDGFEQCFQQRLIASVQFEHGTSHILSGHTLKYFVDFFARHDFQVYKVFPKKLEPIDYKLADDVYTGQNLFAVHTALIGRL